MLEAAGLIMENATLDLTVLLPTLNEAENLKRLLPRIISALSSLNVRHEILVVDGGSSDGTAALAERLGARVIKQKAAGYGQALLEGAREARGEYVLMMDADGSHPPEAIMRLWNSRAGKDLVVASRYIPGGSADMPFARYLLSRLLNWVTFQIWRLPVRDASSGFKLYRASVLKGLEWKSADFAAHQEILGRLLENGAKVGEVPYRFGRRLSGISKAPISSLPVSFFHVWRKAIGKGRNHGQK